ncbi:MAG TPA: metal ABC transporter substrate-binding protein [Candidatus Fusicatenibacter intestinigallinarum]|uniref:Metal ABC transporter substrate-binding protein n=1 Tax=Candidatus Fusicatenibacter intestinigallinarum TaxID=2838598 RepID=A0A9D2NBQ8_9FIRM|nr:metal ABC transporter substrate-binding protein [Candidatus Fusicatenibacter intestinigallinarum]
MKFSKLFSAFIPASVLLLLLSGCASPGTAGSEDSGKIRAVATIFPQYDFLRQIGGDHLELTMLLKPGAESHSFEPTPADMITVSQSDLFVYVGGDSDAWVETILESVDVSEKEIVTLMDCVETVAEEDVEGMETHGHAHDHEDEDPTAADGDHEEAEQDEHVWTSPRNAVRIVEKLRDALIAVDPENAGDYTQNAADYIDRLNRLDQEFQETVDTAKRHTILLGDRFPFRYLADAYGLDYYAAFPGCSSESEASAKTIAFLIDKVKEEKIPVVFSIELSNEKMTDSICEATGATKLQLHSCHNVTRDDFEQGITYLDLMERNVQALKEALN